MKTLTISALLLLTTITLSSFILSRKQQGEAAQTKQQHPQYIKMHRGMAVSSFHQAAAPGKLAQN